jgi:hypothetical protein
MIRTTYRGRAIRILAVRGKPDQRKLIINGYTTNHGWEGDDQQALDWFKRLIDDLDANGGPGHIASSSRFYNQYTSPHWWEPGAIDINPRGHATAPGGICMCSQCTLPDKARFAPLAVDACRYCHQIPDRHHNGYDLMNTHFYKEPTDAQRAGRQATIDRFNAIPYDDEGEVA